ncbi:hypothetical protein ACFL5G_04035 [Candidatus Margulisiibacteriota bacterium]
MALVDIENKIVREAKQEAKKIIRLATEEQAGKLKAAAAELAAGKNSAQQALQKKIEQAVEQRRMLAKLEAEQEVLQAKREVLDKVLIELIAEVLRDSKLTESFFIKVLKEVSKYIVPKGVKLEVAAKNEKELSKAVKDLKLTVEISANKRWGPGRMEVVLPRSRMDCSLDLYLKEKLAAAEKQSAAELFA